MSENKTISYENFKKEIFENILDYLPDSYKGCVVQIAQILKPNKKIDVLSLVDTDSQFSPSLYIEDYYDHYLKGCSIHYILKDMAANYLEAMQYVKRQNLDLNSLTDYENVKDLIYPRLIDKNSNREFLEGVPHKEMADLAITYAIRINAASPTPGLATVSNSLFDCWKKDINEIHEASIRNMERADDIEFSNINELLKRIYGSMYKTACLNFWGPTYKENCQGNDLIPLYVLKSEHSVPYGAALLLSKNLMQHVIKTCGKNLLILLSSIYNCIIIPNVDDESIPSFRQMVEEVNNNAVEVQERLSNNVYRYDPEKNELYIA